MSETKRTMKEAVKKAMECATDPDLKFGPYRMVCVEEIKFDDKSQD